MRACVQRVSRASVRIDHEVVGAINRGDGNMTAGGMSLTYIDHLKRHMKCQHAAIIAVQLHADLDS